MPINFKKLMQDKYDSLGPEEKQLYDMKKRLEELNALHTENLVVYQELSNGKLKEIPTVFKLYRKIFTETTTGTINVQQKYTFSFDGNWSYYWDKYLSKGHISDRGIYVDAGAKIFVHPADWSRLYDICLKLVPEETKNVEPEFDYYYYTLKDYDVVMSCNLISNSEDSKKQRLTSLNTECKMSCGNGTETFIHELINDFLAREDLKDVTKQYIIETIANLLTIKI